MSRSAPVTHQEVFFAPEEIIVSKTDLRGIITYANDVFQNVSGYTEAELLGQPHNILRHPDMPACVFRLLWNTVQRGEEIFAYVVNRAKNGDHYWVFAHVTPSFDPQRRIIGYHSNRRVPYPDALPKVKELYAQLLEVERSAGDRNGGIEAGLRAVQDLLAGQGMDYAEFVFGLSEHTRMEATV